MTDKEWFRYYVEERTAVYRKEARKMLSSLTDIPDRIGALKDAGYEFSDEEIRRIGTDLRQSFIAMDKISDTLSSLVNDLYRIDEGIKQD